jgi:hypothetical protein
MSDGTAFEGLVACAIVILVVLVCVVVGLISTLRKRHGPDNA